MDDKRNELDFHMCMNCRAQFIGIENFATHKKACHPPTVSYPQEYWNIPRLRPLRTPSPHTTLFSPSSTSSSSDEDADISFIEKEFRQFQELYGADDCDSDDSLSETDAPYDDMLYVEGKGKGSGPSSTPTDVKGRVSCSGDLIDHPSERLAGQFPNDVVIPLEKGVLSYSGDHKCAQGRGDDATVDVSIGDPKKLATEERAGLGSKYLCRSANVDVRRNNEATPTKELHEILSRGANVFAPTWCMNNSQLFTVDGGTTTHIDELSNVMATSKDVTDSSCAMHRALSNSHQSPVAKSLVIVIYKKKLTNGSEETRQVTCEMTTSKVEMAGRKDQCTDFSIVEAAPVPMSHRGSPADVRPEMTASAYDGTQILCTSSLDHFGMDKIIGEKEREETTRQRIVERNGKGMIPTQTGHNFRSSVVKDGGIMSGDVSKKRGMSPFKSTLGRGNGKGMMSAQNSSKVGVNVVTDEQTGLKSKGNEHTGFTYNFSELDHSWISKRKKNEGVEDGQAEEEISLIDTASGGTSRRKPGRSKGRDRRSFEAKGGNNESRGWMDVSQDYFPNDCENTVTMVHDALREKPLLGDVLESFPRKSQRKTCIETAHSHRNEEMAVSSSSTDVVTDRWMSGDISKEEAENSTSFIEDVSDVRNERIFAEMEGVINNGLTDRQMDESTSKFYRSSGALFGKRSECKDSDYRQMSSYISRETKGIKASFIDDVSGREGQGCTAQRNDTIRSIATGRQTEDCAPYVGGVLCYRKRGKVGSPKGNGRKTCAFKESGQTLRNDASHQLEFPSVSEGMKAVIGGRSSRHIEAGSNCLFNESKLPSTKQSSESSNTTPNALDYFHNVIESMCSLAGEKTKSSFSEDIQIIEEVQRIKDVKGNPKGIDESPAAVSKPPNINEVHNGSAIPLGSIEPTETRLAGEQSKSRVSDDVQIIAEMQCIKDIKGSPEGINESPVAISKPPNFKEVRNGCVIPLDSIEPTETRIDSTQGELPAATACSDNRSAQMKGMLMAALSLRSVAQEVDKEALTTKVRRLRSSQHTSYSREGAGEFSSMPSDNASNVSNTPLLEELSHLIEWLRSSEHVSSCRDSHIEGCASFGGNSSYVGTPGCKGKVKLLARKYQKISSCRKYLTSPIHEDVSHVLTASSKVEHNNVDRTIQEVSSLVENRKSASQDDMCNGGTAASEGRISCAIIPSKQASSCMERLSETTSSLNDNKSDAGATSEGKLACTTLLSDHPSICAENLRGTLSASIGNTFHAQTTPEDKIAYPMMPSDQVGSCVESLIKSPFTSIDNTFCVGTTSANKITCHAMQSDQVSSCAESLSEDLSVSNDITSDAGSTSPQGNLTCATNALHHVSSHLEKLPQMSPAADYNNCDVATTNRSDKCKNLIRISSQLTQSCGENNSKNSFISFTSTEKSPIHVDSETEYDPSSKRLHKLNIKSKRMMTSEKRPAKVKAGSIIPLSINLGYRCDSIEFLRQHHASPFLPKNADAEREDKTVSYHSEEEEVTSKTEPSTSSVPMEEPENTNPSACSLDIIASSVPIEEPENKDPMTTCRMDIMDKVNLLSLALGKSFSFSIKPKSLIIGTDDSKKASSSMIRHDYLTPNAKHVCRCFCTCLNPSLSHGVSSTTLQEQ